MSAKDIIRSVIECMMRHEPSITEELALVVERECRAEWGGQSVSYIARTCEADRPRSRLDVDAVRADYAGQMPVPELTARHGISRATLYRLIKR